MIFGYQLWFQIQCKITKWNLIFQNLSLHVDSEDRFSQDDGPEVEDGELVDSRGADTVSSQAGVCPIIQFFSITRK